MSINLQEIYEWRWIDPSNGLVLPYYTRPCLDWLMKLDLKGKRIFEYGCGASTVWYRNKGAKVFGVESNENWHKAVMDACDCNIKLSTPDAYPYEIRGEFKYDIIVIDGIERDLCLKPSLQYLKKGGLLIIDNFDQPSAYVPSKTVKDAVLSLNHIIYPQPGHPDWKTLVAWI